MSERTNKGISLCMNLSVTMELDFYLKQRRRFLAVKQGSPCYKKSLPCYTKEALVF